MIQVFVFLGEFGYELLNWQGAVRKFRRLSPDTLVVCASRGAVGAIYGDAWYVDIGDVPEFRESVAIGYFALKPGDLRPTSDANVAFDARLRAALERAIKQRLRDQWRSRYAIRRVRGMRFTFSSERTVLRDCTFGANRLLFGSVPAEGDIYDLLDLSNNLYAQVAPELGHQQALEERLGISLDSPYVLVQSRRREIVPRSTAKVDESRLVAALAERAPVVLVDFSTGRAQDSYSRLTDVPGVHRVGLTGFGEQSCLVAKAAACVFPTEGDFGSHIYVPPLLGRDVLAVAPRDIYELGTTPIDHWNRHVFRFGGNILPVIAEELAEADALRGLADEVSARVAAAP